MAQALMHPLIEQKVQPAEKITVYDVSNSTMKKISEQYDGKINTSESIPHALQDADLIILAVKPQNVCKVYEEMRKADISKNSTLLSVIAGKPISVSTYSDEIFFSFIYYDSNFIYLDRVSPMAPEWQRLQEVCQTLLL